MSNNSIDFAEIRKLYARLNEAGIPCTLAPLYDGWQVCVYADEDKTKELDDAIIHSGSYGHQNGLLETFALSNCEGRETAEQVFEGWLKMYRTANAKKIETCDCTVIGAGGEIWEGSAPSWD